MKRFASLLLLALSGLVVPSGAMAAEQGVQLSYGKGVVEGTITVIAPPYWPAVTFVKTYEPRPSMSSDAPAPVNEDGMVVEVSGSVDYTVQRPDETVAASGSITLIDGKGSKDSDGPLPAGKYKLCVTNGTATVCEDIEQLPMTETLLGHKVKGGRLILRADPALVGQTVRIRFLDRVILAAANPKETVRHVRVRLRARTVVKVPAKVASTSEREYRVTLPRFTKDGLLYRRADFWG